MKTLKESILSRTADKVSTAKKDIDNLKYFGTHFKVDHLLEFIKPIDVGGMSLRALKKYSQPDIFFSKEDEVSHEFANEKAIHFCKYLYAVDLTAMNIDVDDLLTDTATRLRFTNGLEEKMKTDGVMQDTYHIRIEENARFLKEGYVVMSFTRNGKKWANFKLGFYTREQ
jgi:hypothetical protein